MPAEEFINPMYNHEEGSVCARDIYEKESGVFKYILAICCKYISLLV